MSYELKKVEIVSTAFGGDGVCRIDGAACFVTGAFPGEKARIEITQKKKNFLRAVAREITAPSPDRCKAVCPLAFSCSDKNLWCPGCTYQSISYDKEIEFKEDQFIQLLKRFAGVSSDVKHPALSSQVNLNYRNKIKLHFDYTRKKYGFISNDNRQILDVQNCPLACKEINDAIPLLYSQKTFYEKVTLRKTTKDSVKIFDSASRPSELITQDTPLGDILVPLTSFFQVNPCSHKILIEKFNELIDRIKPDLFFDIYCGSGLFAIAAAKKDIPSIGIEIDLPAVDAARLNAEKHSLNKITEFIRGDAGKIKEKFQKLKKDGNICALVDPPRTGLDRSLIDSLCGSRLKNIIYISCAPDTLCRDLKIFIQNGYDVISAQIVDMFPRTAHFESITHLKLKQTLSESMSLN